MMRKYFMESNTAEDPKRRQRSRLLMNLFITGVYVGAMAALGILAQEALDGLEKEPYKSNLAGMKPKL